MSGLPEDHNGEDPEADALLYAVCAGVVLGFAAAVVLAMILYALGVPR